MLTRYEITNVAFPNPSINELLLQREPPDRKPNIISREIFGASPRRRAVREIVESMKLGETRVYRLE